MAHDHGGVAEGQPGRDRDRHAGRQRHQLRKAARPLDAHHAGRPGIIVAVLGAGIERHGAGDRDPVADLPAGHAGPDRIHDAGAVDARDQRQHRGAARLLAGAQAHVEHAVDGGGVNPHPDLAQAGQRIRNILVAEDVGRPELVDHDRLHAQACLRNGCRGHHSIE